jgi:hypothetical protein
MQTLPLRDDDINKPNIPPNAGSEVTDLEPTASGIDDGLLPPNRPDGRPGITPGSRIGSRPPLYNLGDCYLMPSYLVFMLCMTLVAVNIDQLKYVLESGGDHHLYYLVLITISFSIILQVALYAGVLLCELHNERREVWKVHCIEIFIEVGILLIPLLNLPIIVILNRRANINSGATEKIIEDAGVENVTMDYT